MSAAFVDIFADNISPVSTGVTVQSAADIPSPL